MWKCYKFTLLLFLFLDIGPAFPFILEFIGFIADVVTIFKATEPKAKKRSDVGLSDREIQTEIFETVNNIYANLSHEYTQFETFGEDIIASLMQNTPAETQSHLQLHSLMKNIIQMREFFANMRYYINNTDIERSTLEEFAKNVTSHDSSSIRNISEIIHSYLISSNPEVTGGGILDLIVTFLQKHDGYMRCNNDQSPQQMIFNLYITITLMELRFYVMTQFSYIILKLYGTGNYTEEAQLITDRFQQHVVQCTKVIKQFMKSTSREFWRCEPPKQISGTTYIEVTELLQGYVVNEADISESNTCKKTCPDYDKTKVHRCTKKDFCDLQRTCQGRVLDCQFRDLNMQICHARNSTKRRYEYIDYGKTERSGTKHEECWTYEAEIWSKSESERCDYCFCLCDDDGDYSDRYFNMLSVIANVEENKVVTGLRFTKQNRIIYLQIQEGRLLPQGNIEKGSVRWVPVKDYKITNGKNGKDYHKLSWEERSIDLDNLIADDGHLLTGVRFRKVESHLNFQICITPFDFETGILSFNNSRWINNIGGSRTEVKLMQPDVPTVKSTVSTPTFKLNQYIKFTHTDIDRDAAQITVPFLDAQPVEPVLHTPLAGAGLFHKGTQNSGGYIAPKVTTYDFSKHLNPEVL